MSLNSKVSPISLTGVDCCSISRKENIEKGKKVSRKNKQTNIKTKKQQRNGSFTLVKTEQRETRFSNYDCEQSVKRYLMYLITTKIIIIMHLYTAILTYGWAV